jgi:hypothetical protein
MEIHDIQLLLTTYFIFMLGLTSHPETHINTRNIIQISNVLLVCLMVYVVVKL